MHGIEYALQETGERKAADNWTRIYAGPFHNDTNYVIEYSIVGGEHDGSTSGRRRRGASRPHIPGIYIKLLATCMESWMFDGGRRCAVTRAEYRELRTMPSRRSTEHSLCMYISSYILRFFLRPTVCSRFCSIRTLLSQDAEPNTAFRDEMEATHYQWTPVLFNS